MQLLRSISAIAILLPLIAQAKVYDVQVGPNGSLTFVPSDLTIGIGDSINFVFSGTHTVTQGQGCVKDPNAQFDLHDTGVQTFPTSGTYPFFCSVPGHCQAGMRGNILVTVAAAVNGTTVPQPGNGLPQSKTSSGSNIAEGWVPMTLALMLTSLAQI